MTFLLPPGIKGLTGQIWNHLCWSLSLIQNIAKFLKGPILKNICEGLRLKMCLLMKLRKTKKYSSGVFNFTFREQFFSTSISENKWKYLFLFHDWFPMKFVFTYNLSLVWLEINCKHQISTRVNQKKIKSSRKEYVMWTCFKFWPMKSIFRKLYNKPMRVWL